MDIDRKKHLHLLPSNTEDEGGWLFSYADMMTLLMAFFVLIVAISKIDPIKMEIIAQSMSEAIRGTHVEPRVTLSQIQSDLEGLVKKEGMEAQVSVDRDAHGVSLNLRGSSFFKSGSTDLRSEAVPFLKMVAGEIDQVPYAIAIEGHTDNVPISSKLFPSNWELSSARAAKVVRFFVDQGLPIHRFRVVGFADTKPVDKLVGNTTPEARAQNRRVVILFLDVLNQ